MDKTYSPSTHEAAIYNLWEGSKAFTPIIKKNKQPFTVIMPPPNANDPLHVGHARFITISDTLVRYHRMKGNPTLWLPGADHAGIETQYVFEKKLKLKGKSRTDYDRGTLYKMIYDYVQENKATMEEQLKLLGASADWTKRKFTLDKDIVNIVKETFQKLYDDGLVYRGEKIVNYSPSSGTFFSELEVEYVDKKGLLYFIDYGSITIATTRPETIFGDTAVAVNPNDKRYKKLLGKVATIPIINRSIPIIADELVDKSFGTGALKITPAHDATDFEIGQKHNLMAISVIDKSGRMINTPPQYINLKASIAREQVVKDIEAEGKLKKTEQIVHAVGLDYKTKQPIEPMLTKQWFIRVDPLKKEAIKAIKEKCVIFANKSDEKKALHWLKNLRDWNVSRQIVWGIQIPAWRENKNPNNWVVSLSTPNKNDYTRDTDTLDTWFSSGQWPFATLKSIGNEEFNYYYPTSLMVTASDILYLWVTRMLMLGLYITKEVPFKQVLLYGLVRDKEGQKISKSKGNVIDPIVMTKKYGTDALRMALIWGSKIESDISLNEQNILAQRNFSNKLWNIARYISQDQNKLYYSANIPKTKSREDKKIISELKKATSLITKSLETYKLNEGAEILYNFTWNHFANDYLEASKSKKSESIPVLEYILQQTLLLAHPFMPFISEAIWQTLYAKNKKDLLMLKSWPE